LSYAENAELFKFIIAKIMGQAALVGDVLPVTAHEKSHDFIGQA